jgi:hypothetical protein
MDMPTRGAHSFRTRPLSSDWNAPITKETSCVRILLGCDGSTVMDRMRRKKEENSAGWVAKCSIQCQRIVPSR